MSGRFVDYFAVCGLDPELELDEVRVLQQRLEPNQNEEPQNHTDLLHRTFRSRVLAHFPENVEGNPFDPDAVNMLSVPGGLRFWSQPQAPRFHSFLITREDYSRTYGFVLTFSERVQTQARTQTQTLSRDQGRDQGGDQGPCSSWSLDSLLVSLGEDQVYVCKALVILAPLPFMGVYRNFLWQLHRAVTAETSPPLPLESYIYNLLYEVPLPPPGLSVQVQGVYEPVCVTVGFLQVPLPPPGLSVQVQGVYEPVCVTVGFLQVPLPPPGLSVQVQGVYEPVWCHRPGTAELPLLDFSVSDALLRLGPQQLLQVFSCLLLEHQVLLYSQDPQLLVVVGEVMCSLLFPFQWQHVYVPLLPAALSHFLDAPVPYLMGLQGQDRSQLDLPQEANLCFVDLDNSSVDVPEDFPQFPLQEELILELKDILQRHSAPETSSGPGPPPLDPLSLQDQCNGNVPSEVLDLLQKNQTLQRLEALTRRARVSVTQEGRGLSGRLQQEKKAAILNTQLREVFAARFVAMFCDYDAFVIHSCSDLHSWLTARENMHNFDKASFLSEQPEHLLPFLARFIETQMFASFIDNKIMSQWNQQEAQLRLFDQRIQTRRLYQQRATTYQLQQAVQAVEQRYQRVAHTAVLPHLLRMRIGQGRFTPGTFPRLQQEVLKAPTTR
uniref:UDENN domain-containing protein n=1 Tax=Knipowitschia caucasica TaxID=637954 RepID=A0AAV2IQ48_KNICA